jgi:hypothetical protein
MRADKTEPRRRHIRLETGAQATTAVRDPQKTSLFEVPSTQQCRLSFQSPICFPLRELRANSFPFRLTIGVPRRGTMHPVDAKPPHRRRAISRCLHVNGTTSLRAIICNRLNAS